MNSFKKGTILVCISDQKTGCGILYVKVGSIIKVAEEKPEWWATIPIYRNQDAEKNDHTHSIEKEKVRLATAEEVEAWNNEIYFIQDLKVNADGDNN
jgi:hypothetical protein